MNSLKKSLILISTLSLNGCIGLTLAGAAVGGVNALDKEHRISKIEKQLEKLMKEKEESKPKLYVPSYSDMDSFNKGLYGTMYPEKKDDEDK